MNAPNCPLYPDVTAHIIGRDGNAMVIMNTVIQALRHHGHGDQCQRFMQEAMDGDYNNVLTTAMKWVNVE